MKIEDKKILLDIARRNIEAAVKGTPVDVADLCTDSPDLQKKQGAFVTIRTQRSLRGCIGSLSPNLPLHETVADMAASAVTRDTRFLTNQVTEAELGELEIEISVLSPLQKIKDPQEIEPGKHGIYIKKGYRTGCFLPQVATETGWTTEEFLSQCCSTKAGLAPNAWKEKGTEVYVFTAEVIS